MDEIQTYRWDKVQLMHVDGNTEVEGRLHLTELEVVFGARNLATAEPIEIWICLQTIESAELAPHGNRSLLLIRTKTFRAYRFVMDFDKDSEICSLLTKRPGLDLLINRLKPPCQNGSDEPSIDIYDTFSDNPHISNWTLYSNIDGARLCDTYPDKFYVPKNVSGVSLRSSAGFRSSSRLPALTYLHHNSASITRCSQPLVGFSARCKEDEEYLDIILQTNKRYKDVLNVVDTRPMKNAMMNKAKGKGWESEYYVNIDHVFKPIENIHVMRLSLQKMLEVTLNPKVAMSEFLSKLESSGWLKHIQALLDCSKYIADKVYKGESVLVHCSDGWDRTAQVCSLAQILLNPHFRTITGFRQLIAKDWLAFGHKFSDRCGFLDFAEAREQSPVFTQFLDAVNHLMRQFPKEFEFSSAYLVALHDALHTCQYPTFLGNCEKDREDLFKSARSDAETSLRPSIWSTLTSPNLLNPLYAEMSNQLLIPSMSPQHFEVWLEMYSPQLELETAMPQLAVHLRHTAALAAGRVALNAQLLSLGDKLGHSEHVLRKKVAGIHSSQSRHQLAQVFPSMDDIAGIVSEMDDQLLTRSYNSGGESGFVDDPLSSWASQKDAEKLQEVNPAQSAPTTPMWQSMPSIGTTTVSSGIGMVTPVALQWNQLHLARNCARCKRALGDRPAAKEHCWHCGMIFCNSCVKRNGTILEVQGDDKATFCTSCNETFVTPVLLVAQ